MNTSGSASPQGDQPPMECAIFSCDATTGALTVIQLPFLPPTRVLLCDGSRLILADYLAQPQDASALSVDQPSPVDFDPRDDGDAPILLPRPPSA